MEDFRDLLEELEDIKVVGELENLREAFESAASGRGRVVFVVGEPLWQEAWPPTSTCRIRASITAGLVFIS